MELWSEPERLLWQRIQMHPLHSDSKLDFHKRLCREQRWTSGYGSKVIEEYRRFVFLNCVSHLSLTPSVDVDETWHLHLTYSEDYWLEFCPKVLQRSLHHRPTSGSLADSKRFREQYAKTLQTYAAWFGPPDRKVWPGSEERFARPDRFQRINRELFWILPKPWSPRS